VRRRSIKLGAIHCSFDVVSDRAADPNPIAKILVRRRNADHVSAADGIDDAREPFAPWFIVLRERVTSDLRRSLERIETVAKLSAPSRDQASVAGINFIKQIKLIDCRNSVPWAFENHALTRSVGIAKDKRRDRSVFWIIRFINPNPFAVAVPFRASAMSPENVAVLIPDRKT